MIRRIRTRLGRTVPIRVVRLARRLHAAAGPEIVTVQPPEPDFDEAGTAQEYLWRRVRTLMPHATRISLELRVARREDEIDFPWIAYVDVTDGDVRHQLRSGGTSLLAAAVGAGYVLKRKVDVDRDRLDLA